MLFNNIIDELKKTGIKDFEIVVERDNYIIRKIIESRENLQLSCNNDKVKYVIKV